MYDIRIVVISAANDDGSQAVIPDSSSIAKSVDIANKVYSPHGFNFLFDPSTDLYKFNDDRLNHDCERMDNRPYTIKRHTDDIYLNDFYKNNNFNYKLFNDHQTNFALGFPGRITIIFNAGCRYDWDYKEMRWIYRPRTFNSSSSESQFIQMGIGSLNDDHSLAHEIGHYLHLRHTFNILPESEEEAVAAIKDQVENRGQSKDKVLEYFDGDGIKDTLPDPGTKLFKDPCDRAEKSVTISVDFADGSKQTYTFAPDRENIMEDFEQRCISNLYGYLC